MALFSPDELDDIAEEIKRVMLGLSTDLLGKDITAVSEEEYQELLDAGLVTEDDINYFKEAFNGGWAYAHAEIEGSELPLPNVSSVQAAMTAPDGPPPLSEPQQRALSYVQQHAATSIKGLGNRIADDFSTLAIETENATRMLLESQIREAIEESVLNGETAQRLASRIGDSTQDYARDLKRIAVYELESAHQHGWAEYYKDTDPGSMVAKRVAPDGCKYCKQAFEEAPGIPKIFPLSQLEANGTNIGKKRAEWLPVIGPMHPFCHCQLIRVPSGFVFNDVGQLVPESMAKANASSTPAKPSERVKGSKKNKAGSAKDTRGGIVLSESVIESLKGKVSDHNESSSKKVTLGQLKAVYRRGAGAFSTSHHPNANRHSWSMGRVNSFLRRVKGGAGHSQDDDLIKKAGPFIGPRGGKWADSDHTIPWHEQKDVPGFRHLEKLKAWANKKGLSSAKEFSSANLSGVAAKTTSHVVGQMVVASRTKVDAKAIHEELSRSGDWHFLHKVDVSSVDSDTHGKVTPSGKEDLTKPIIINHKGEVIDGRHRVAVARKMGIKELPAYMPASEMFRRHMQGAETGLKRSKAAPGYSRGDGLIKKAQETYSVPQSVRSAAKRGLELRKKQSKSNKAGLDTREAGRQGIGSGVARARDLIGGTVSKETIKRMHAYFSRHRSNYKLDPGKKPHEDKGYVAGLLWGGEAGRKFAARMVERFNREDSKIKKSTEVLFV